MAATKRKSLSLKEKIDVIIKAEKNPALTTTSVGKFFGIARTTVSSILKEKEIYKQLYSQSKQHFPHTGCLSQNQHSQWCTFRETPDITSPAPKSDAITDSWI